MKLSRSNAGATTLLILAVGSLVPGVAAAQAARPVPEIGPWQFIATVYGWVPTIDGRGNFPDDQGSTGIGCSGNDAHFLPVGFEVGVERRSLTDVGQIERAGEHRFHRRWSGVVSEPLDLHLWSKSLLEPAFSLARKGVCDHPLGVSDVREMAEAYDNLFLGRNELRKNTDRGSYEQD